MKRCPKCRTEMDKRAINATGHEGTTARYFQCPVDGTVRPR